ncbi:uncharacterized protein LOC101899308 [Musca domestica]|uniref:Uncharacterized protein LOC101899308 n=1 Tax=Musca domestica TaxID=7370 RepID=A0A1I8M8W7_MUSDO|nr:uncharacterized protein LOC101899308 [Musca domestica]
MTNKALDHISNANNSEHQNRISSPLNTAAVVTSKLSSSSSTTTAKATATLSNAISSTQINNHYNKSNNSNNSNRNADSKSCPEGGNNKVNDYHTDKAGCRQNPIKAYAHGIWYQDYDTIDNNVQQQIQLMQLQRQRFQSSNNTNNDNENENENNKKAKNNVRATMSLSNLDESGNLFNSVHGDEVITGKQKQQQQQQQASSMDKCLNENNNHGNNTHTNNCDIVVIDIEDEQLFEGSNPGQSLAPAPFHFSGRPVLKQRSIDISHGNMRHQTISNRNSQHENVKDCLGNIDIDGGSNQQDNDGDHNDDDDDDDDDSLVSLETLSDNVSIWIDGEKHWIAGVDAQTTCSDLIWALLHYQNGQSDGKSASAADDNGRGYTLETPNDSKDNQIIENNCETSRAMDFNNCHSNTMANSGLANNFNQSMPKNTKEENCKIKQNPATTTSTARTASSCPNGSRFPATALPFPPGISSAAQLTTEYVIVKQYHHCEEYLDGSTKIFDVLPPRNSQHKKECELLLRRLGPAPVTAYANNNNSNNNSSSNTANTPQLSSLISTDKDSGMGSPVGSARSAKFRRRKHKSSQWLAQANTLHPKLSRCTATANERLLKIIMAQDETIQRQLSLLREKERQINKIEEEKHRKRERELGKNYLLETYLNGLDEAECQPQPQDGEEIFIDEPCQQFCETTTHTSTKDTLTMDILDNFKPKDSKKDKRKKRAKEKSSNIETKLSASGMQRTKDKFEKVARQHYNNNTTNIPGSIFEEEQDFKLNGEDVVSRNQTEIELQIFWLEKVYTLNKQLQREEELAAKLHAKIRKHQLKKANQTQKEVQLEMDKLDNNLALQCGNIRRVEATLMETNEQLQKKLAILERLSLEYLRQQQGDDEQEEALTARQQNLENEKNASGLQQQHHHQPLLDTSKEATQKVLLINNIKSVEEVVQLQKLISKPNCEQQRMKTSIPLRHSNAEQLVHAAPQMSGVTALTHHHHHHHPQQQTNEERQLNPDFVANNEGQVAPLTNVAKPLRPQSTHCLQLLEELEEFTVPPNEGQEPTAARFYNTPDPTRAMSPVCVAIDKNMSTSLHVQNAKTIKKQMFHSHAAATTDTKATEAISLTSPVPFSAAGTAMLFVLPTASMQTTGKTTKLTMPPPPPPPKPTEINAFTTTSTPTVKTIQQCQNFNQHMAHLTRPSSHVDLTPWQQHQAFSSGPAKLAAETSPTIVQATKVAVALPASTSSPASLVAMNTVDISQLGTLV